MPTCHCVIVSSCRGLGCAYENNGKGKLNAQNLHLDVGVSVQTTCSDTSKHKKIIMICWVIKMAVFATRLCNISEQKPSKGPKALICGILGFWGLGFRLSTLPSQTRLKSERKRRLGCGHDPSNWFLVQGLENLDFKDKLH